MHVPLGQPQGNRCHRSFVGGMTTHTRVFSTDRMQGAGTKRDSPRFGGRGPRSRTTDRRGASSVPARSHTNGSAPPSPKTHVRGAPVVERSRHSLASAPPSYEPLLSVGSSPHNHSRTWFTSPSYSTDASTSASQACASKGKRSPPSITPSPAAHIHIRDQAPSATMS